MPPSGKFYLASGAGGPKEPLYSLLYVDKKADGRERELSLELSNDDSIMHIDNKVLQFLYMTVNWISLV